jgi:DNA repair protein RecN (Recombination protein N)
MLTQLSIQDYSLVEKLDLEFFNGMTVITGETGAGKSIMLDALGLTLGDRADAKTVRQGKNRADIHACFDIQKIPAALDWLKARDLQEGEECILRRVVTREGRSRGYINGQPAPLQDLKSLGGLLIDIHSQHEHQSLLNRNSHLRLLDDFAGHNNLLDEVRSGYQRWHNISQRLTELHETQSHAKAHQQLLEYQVHELDELGLAEDELAKLEATQKTLANAEDYLQAGQQALDLCRDNETGNALSLINQAISKLGDLPDTDKYVSESLQLLHSVEIQLQEAGHELQAYLDNFSTDPERLVETENRLSAIYQIARKHQIVPEHLFSTYLSLNEDLNALQNDDKEIVVLQQELETLNKQYSKAAEKLAASRRQAAKKLVKQTQKQLQALGMNHCKFEIAFANGMPDTPTLHGIDQAEFLISTNPGTPSGPLNKIASGGELSRISLAIQVVTAATSSTPSLVFDEVDVGVGGAIAEVIGKLLRELGKQVQVICVTHLPQVAAKGHHHINVSKQTRKKCTSAHLSILAEEQKIEEIARMLGGIAITDKSRAHAREMLNPPH